MSERTQIWSNGGGVQSAAIAAAIYTGKLPKPDLCAIVDTEREGSRTWEYMEEFIIPAFQEMGIILHRVFKSDYAKTDLYSKKKDSILIPAFTDFSGEIGKLPTYCSSEWKKRVLRRWATEQGVKQADVWIGFSTDELHRCYQEAGKWQPRYPLAELRMNRGDCIALVKRVGWDEPPRSSCWMCPNKTQYEWREMKENNPSDFKKAIQFEKEIRTKDDSLFLTQEGKLLGDCEFKETEDLFNSGKCTSGMCFV